MKKILLCLALAAMLPAAVLAQAAAPAPAAPPAVPAAAPVPPPAPVDPAAVPPAPVDPAAGVPVAPPAPGGLIDNLQTLQTQIGAVQSAAQTVQTNVQPVEASIKQLYQIGTSYPQQVTDFKAKYGIPQAGASGEQEFDGVSRALLQKAGMDTTEANVVTKAMENASTTAKAFQPLAPQNIMISVGITAGMSVLGQLASTGKVDLKSAMGFLGDKGFWGGLVGSGVGYSLAALAVQAFLPPGFGGVVAAFLPTMGAMTGAYLGGALGTDVANGKSLQDSFKGISIAEILAEAAGSTLGMFVGANVMTAVASGIGSFAGPLGSIVGGMLGATLGRWAVNTVKGMLSGASAGSVAGGAGNAPNPASSNIAAAGLPGAAILPASDIKNLQDSYRNEYVQYVQAEQSGDTASRDAHLASLKALQQQYELSVRSLMSNMATPGHQSPGH